MQPLNLKPTHKLVKDYYKVLGQFGQLHIDHEVAVRSAFQGLLAAAASGSIGHWFRNTPSSRPKAEPITRRRRAARFLHLAHGYWEAKDEHDDLDKEIRAKLEKGYPAHQHHLSGARARGPLPEWRPSGTEHRHYATPKNLVELLKILRISRARPRGMGRRGRRIQGAHPRNC